MIILNLIEGNFHCILSGMPQAGVEVLLDASAFSSGMLSAINVLLVFPKTRS